MPERKMPAAAPWQKKSKRSPVRRAPVPKAEHYPASPAQKPTKLRIIAVDPGITTGMAFRVNGKLATCVSFSEDEVLDLIRDADIVVVEKFATAGRISMPGLVTTELVGSIRGWVRAHNKLTPHQTQFETATPQQRWAFMNEAIDNIGRDKLIEPSRVAKHERDALAHLFAWEYRNSL